AQAGAAAPGHPAHARRRQRRGLSRRDPADHLRGPGHPPGALSPYQPTSKGKLERWHRTVREQFLAELDTTHIRDLADLNARLWAWVEQVYHREPHSALGKEVSPLVRYQQDLPRIRALGGLAPKLDELFLHRVERRVRRDGTVSYDGRVFGASSSCASPNWPTASRSCPCGSSMRRRTCRPSSSATSRRS
ncbi:integrase core domain-containing protein, partial [Burkholderia ubonensis]|uniref:integrase core domain-containing protein n=1 Tax=Burkholderia ubonensis TaxID=101571 RepID=UPI001E311EC4